MGRVDPYCFICGGYAFVASIVLHRFKISADVNHIPPVDSERVKRFLFDDADEQFHGDLVSIGPYGRQDEPLIEPTFNSGSQDDVDRLNAVDLNSIRMIKDLVPGDWHELGSLERREGPGGHFTMAPAAYPFGHALCFRLLAAFSQRLMHPVSNFWATTRVLNGPKTPWPPCVNGVDFGDIAGSHEQYIRPFHKYGPPSDDDGDEVDASDNKKDNLPKGIRTALDKETLDPADLRDYWLTKGCMYVWVRPDKFPVRAAFEQPLHLLQCKARSQACHFAELPVDVLLLIVQHVSLHDALTLLALCTTLRAKLVSCIDPIARQHLTSAIPATDGEHERWNEILNRADASSKPFPWLSYARQCRLSPSMRNRQRIWDICQQYEQHAVRLGIL